MHLRKEDIERDDRLPSLNLILNTSVQGILVSMATLVGLPAPVNGHIHPEALLEKAQHELRQDFNAAAASSHVKKQTNGINGHYPPTNGHNENPFVISPEYGYTPRRIKVFTIGAGFSGLLMAHKFQHRFPDMEDIVDHTIFEARHEVGGTWLVNDYPGVQCDVPAHIYAFPFDPNPNWSRFYASGPDILAYIKATVKKWNLDRDLQLNTRVTSAVWQEDLGQYKVILEHAGVRRTEYCHVLISAQGVLV